MKPAAPYVVIMGEVLVEIIATTRGDGFLQPQPLVGPFPSGAPAIFIDQLAKLGTPCAMLSRVGDDDFGRLNVERLRADGVDVSALEIAPGDTTGSAFVRYRADGSRSFVYNLAHSACARMRETPEAAAAIARATHLHVMGTALVAPHLRERILSAAQDIKSRGGSLSFDPNLRPEIRHAPGLREAFAQVLALTDVFLPSGDELFLWDEPQGDEPRAAQNWLARGIHTVAVKREAAGASVYQQGVQWQVPALAVDEIDPTGAGDCFGGAFVHFWLQGADAKTALTYANAAGAHAVTHLGPMEGTATPAQLQALLERTP